MMEEIDPKIQKSDLIIVTSSFPESSVFNNLVPRVSHLTVLGKMRDPGNDT